jgi:hypothetical protein
MIDAVSREPDLRGWQARHNCMIDVVSRAPDLARLPELATTA